VASYSFTCAECGATSPAIEVGTSSSFELDRMPRHAALDVPGVRTVGDAGDTLAFRVERHVCDGSDRAPAAVVQQ
jgi:hypothetical protein